MPIRKVMRVLRKLSGVPEIHQTSPTDATQHSSTSNPASSMMEQRSIESIADKDRITFDLVLYGRPSCPYCARVDRAIKEMGLEDKITRRHTGLGTEWRADLRKRTGSTQVPCLFIDGEPLFESLDIIAWMKANLT